MHPFVNMTLQQTKSDCGLATFAMLVGMNYPDVLAAAVNKDRPTPHKGGLNISELTTLAAKFGYVLQLRIHFDLDEECGLLTVERVKRKRTEHLQHMVLLKWGLVFDTDGVVWEPDVYFSQHGFKPMSLLVVVPQEGN